MNELIKPRALKAGDTVAIISISGGRVGDEDMYERYLEGKTRLENIYNLKVITTPNAMKGSTYLYEHPEARGEDLMWALKNDEVDGIICAMGGDDSYRVFPYIDINVIRENPKVFMGYSDITSWNMLFTVAGVMSYYGPNLLTPIAQPVELDGYTKEAIFRTLFTNDIIGEIKPCDAYTNIEWRTIKKEEIEWTKNEGYRILQGSGVVTGRLFGGCTGPLRQVMGTGYFPEPDFFQDSILFFEVGSPYGSLLAGLHELRGLNAAGVFHQANGLIVSKLTKEEEAMLLKFLKYEVGREDMVVLENLDIAHRTPMTIMPIGAMAEINCEECTLCILESGVR